MISIFNQYPTYQVFLAFIISMALTMIVMPFFIKLLKVRQIGQQMAPRAISSSRARRRWVASSSCS